MSAMVSEVGSSIVKVNFRESLWSSPMSASTEARLSRDGFAPPTVGGLVEVEDREALFDDMSVAGDRVEGRVEAKECWREVAPKEDGGRVEG